MKGSLDNIDSKSGFEIFGILINGLQNALFSMDLNYNSILADHAIEILNTLSTPKDQSYHRLLNTSPQKVLILQKLPPSVIVNDS
ncbi:hypothetical protein F8M41_025598 [Gigaspora margarita]|uniref:Uncharacterized protein n=1 Tax=Gigaspora margarita TaxID=4874 RepID=A0A8H3XJ29_GIGMA|nr:hypothetical protein F8M41_025598 [Gigaspora margarita]